MASLAFVALANSLSGASALAAGTALSTGQIAAATVASVVGAYVDSAFILPKLMKGPDNDQVKGIGITGLDEGDPFTYSIGPECRIPGFLYWQPKKPRFIKGEEGGKGGGSSKSGSQDRYYSDGVYALTRTGIHPETGERFYADTEPQVLWFDGKVRYLGGRRTSAQSAEYEVYESVENVGGFVSLIYTIQTKTPSPAGELLLDWGLDDKFRAGKLLNVDTSALALVPGLGPLFQDGPDGDRQLYAVGSGVRPDGNHYVLIEWEYWQDPSIWNVARNVISGEYQGTYSSAFYGAGGAEFTYTESTFNSEGTGTSQNQRFRTPGGRIPWYAFVDGYTPTDGRWTPPLLTEPAPNSAGSVQNRGYLEFLGGSAGVQVEISQQGRSIEEGLASTITMRSGELNEAPIDVMEDYEGAGDQPALRGFSSVVLEGLFLQDFGNRLPNLEAIVAADRDNVPLAEAISRICTVYCGLPSDQVDVSALEGSGKVVRGYWWKAPYSLEILQPIIIAYDLTVTEYEGKLTFRFRTDAPVYDVPVGDLGSESDSDAGPIVSVTEVGDSEAVLQTTVKYTDPGSTYAIGEQLFTRPDIRSGKTQRLDFTNLTLTAEEARQICQRITWQSSMYRQKLTFTLGPKWGYLRAGDVLLINDLLESNWRLVVTELDRGADGRIEVNCSVDSGGADNVPDVQVDGGGAGESEDAFYSPPIMAPAAMNIGPLVADDYLTPGLYLASAAKFYGAPFRGARWYYSRGQQEFGGIIEQYLTTPPVQSTGLGVSGESVVGQLLTPMLDGAPDVLNEDPDGFLVRLYEGELQAVDLTRLLDRESLIYVNGEVIGFTDAALVDDPNFGYDNTYKISGTLLRGLYNTEANIAAHDAGSDFVLLERYKLDRFQIEPQHVDQTQFRFQSVPTDAEYGSYNKELNLAPVNEGGEGLNVGANNRPFPVAHIRSYAEPSTYTTRAWSNYTLFELDEEIFTFDENGNRLAWKCLQEHNPADEPGSYPELPLSATAQTFWSYIEQPRDYRIRWNFRSPVPQPTLPSSTAETRRDTVKFRLRIIDEASGDIIRTVNNIQEDYYQYTRAQMLEDGTDTGTFLCEVRADNINMTSDPVTAILPGYE